MARKPASKDMIVGSRLRLRRKQRAITEEQLAKILGVDAADITRCESGIARLDAANLARAAQALDAPIGYFFTELAAARRPGPDLPSEPLPETPGAQDLLSAYSLLASSQLQASVLKLVQRLAREAQGCVSATPVEALSPSHHSTSQAR